jgi:hypothetical protein
MKCIINEHTEKQRPQNRSLRNIGNCFNRRSENSRITDLGLSVGSITAKPVNITTRKYKKNTGRSRL